MTYYDGRKQRHFPCWWWCSRVLGQINAQKIFHDMYLGPSIYVRILWPSFGSFPHLPNVHMYAFRVHPPYAYVILSVWYPSVPFQLCLFALLSSYCFTTEIQKFMTYLLTFCLRHPHCTKKWSFLLRISPVHVTKPAVSCGFGNIYWRNL